MNFIPDAEVSVVATSGADSYPSLLLDSAVFVLYVSMYICIVLVCALSILVALR